jgi:hypothetical protein
MPTINDIASLLGTAFDERHVKSLLGVRGEWVETEYDLGHLEDRRRYYVVRPFGLQMLVADDDTVETIFFSLDGDVDVDAYPWTFDRGLRSGFTRAGILAWYGTPSRSGPPQRFAPGGWDRYDKNVTLGTIHFTYRADELRSVSTITLFSEPP